jgi:hypothetical protein
MFISPCELSNINIYLNPDYLNSSTTCRFRTNEMDFEINRDRGENTITMDYHVIFESVQTCNKVADISFQVIATFQTTKFENDDLIGLGIFLTEVYLKIQTFLESEANIPLAMIKPTTNLTSAHDTLLLKDAVFLELTRQGFYR